MLARLSAWAVLAAAGVFAQDALPKGEAILDRYVDVTGGRAAYEKLNSEIVEGTFELAGKGVTAKMTIYRKAPNNSLMVVDVPGVGKMQEGATGEIVWSNSAVQGPRLKAGEERVLSLFRAAFHNELEWRQFFQNVETTGVEEVEGQPCYRVRTTLKDGPEMTQFYDRKTGLLIRITMTLKTQMGAIPSEFTLSDYRDEAGILKPHKAVTKILGQEMVMTFNSFLPNAEIDPARFEVPPEVEALLKK